MDMERLAQSPVGQLVPVKGRDSRHGDFAYFAFLPDPLPEDVTLQSETWTSIAAASATLGRLGQVCRQIPNPQLLIRPAQWREALDTSALEGTVGVLRDLLEAQLPSSQYLTPETAEIHSYFRMANHAFELIHERPITIAFLSELHGELFQDTPHQPRDIGSVRQGFVWIGQEDRPIEEARFVPPPADDRLRAGLDAWEAWVGSDQSHLPPLLRAALTHYQFESLHPFSDGNGRLGRLVVVLELLRSSAIEYPALTVSPWFLKRRQEYQEHLFRVSCTGEWDPWVAFFCQAVMDQCDSLISGAERLLRWLETSRQMLRDRRWTGAIYTLLEGLVEWPVVTIATAAAKCDVTTMNATRMVNHLVEVDILEELTGRNYGRVFGASEVMEIVESI